jgi:hypothetical protein
LIFGAKESEAFSSLFLGLGFRSTNQCLPNLIFHSRECYVLDVARGRPRFSSLTKASFKISMLPHLPRSRGNAKDLPSPHGTSPSPQVSLYYNSYMTPRRFQICRAACTMHKMLHAAFAQPIYCVQTYQHSALQSSLPGFDSRRSHRPDLQLPLFFFGTPLGFGFIYFFPLFPKICIVCVTCLNINVRSGVPGRWLPRNILIHGANKMSPTTTPTPNQVFECRKVSPQIAILLLAGMLRDWNPGLESAPNLLFWPGVPHSRVRGSVQ